MNILLIEDLFILICKATNNANQIKNLASISKFHMEQVQKTKFFNISIRINSKKKLKQMIKNYMFYDLDLSNTNIMDKNINDFFNCTPYFIPFDHHISYSHLMCHTLDLSRTNITDDTVLKLIHYRTLNLSNCKNITDISASQLNNCHTLNLSWTNITDISVSKFDKCQILNLSGTKITDTSVLKLINCYILNLSWTNINDISVSKLFNCNTLDLFKTKVSNECINTLLSYGCNVHI